MVLTKEDKPFLKCSEPTDDTNLRPYLNPILRTEIFPIFIDAPRRTVGIMIHSKPFKL